LPIPSELAELAERKITTTLPLAEQRPLQAEPTRQTEAARVVSVAVSRAMLVDRHLAETSTLLVRLARRIQETPKAALVVHHPTAERAEQDRRHRRFPQSLELPLAAAAAAEAMTTQERQERQERMAG